MNIASKVTAGLVSVIFVGAAIAFAPGVSAQEDDVSALQSQLNALLAQLAALEGGSATTTTTTTTTTSGNAGCFSAGSSVPYVWSRNLTIGSTGEDVRQLQKFLNGNPGITVASSGYGSPGNESSYYGPATARAVSAFQELYASEILTPLGLSKGTGGFYTSTRAKANKVCAGTATTSSQQPVTTPVTDNPYTPKQPVQTPVTVRVSGDELAVTRGKQPADSYAVQGAQRVPYTSFVLTAGSSDVRIEGINIKKFGLSSSRNFDSVALVNVQGVQIGSARSLNSRNEVKVGSGLVIPRNTSVTLAVVAKCRG